MIDELTSSGNTHRSVCFERSYASLVVERGNRLVMSMVWLKRLTSSGRLCANAGAIVVPDHEVRVVWSQAVRSALSARRAARQRTAYRLRAAFWQNGIVRFDGGADVRVFGASVGGHVSPPSDRIRVVVMGRERPGLLSDETDRGAPQETRHLSVRSHGRLTR